jgi:hypothetical protein
MGLNWLYKHCTPLKVFVSVDSDAARNPHRFILQHVTAKQKIPSQFKDSFVNENFVSLFQMI